MRCAAERGADSAARCPYLEAPCRFGLQPTLNPKKNEDFPMEPAPLFAVFALFAFFAVNQPAQTRAGTAMPAAAAFARSELRFSMQKRDQDSYCDVSLTASASGTNSGPTMPLRRPTI